MFRSRNDIIVCLLLFLLSLFVFTRGLSVHGLEYRDDEIFYFKSTQEMVHTGNIMSPTYFGENRFQKPILYYWLVLLSYKVFGVNWFGARFVAVVFAGLTICVTWLIGKILFNRKIAILSAIILMTVPLFFRHAKNAVPDMPLNFFIVLAIYYAIQFIHPSQKTTGLPVDVRHKTRRICHDLWQKCEKASASEESRRSLGGGGLQHENIGAKQGKTKWYHGLCPWGSMRTSLIPAGKPKKKTALIKYNTLFFVACAFGFMIKGFAALIIPILTVILYSFIAKKPEILGEMRFGRGALIMLLIMCPWFFYMIKMHGHEYLNYMLIDETKNRLVNTTSGNVPMNMVMTFFDHCVFYLNVIGSYFAPWCLFLAGAIPLAFSRIMKKDRRNEGLRLMLVWFFVVFCFFSMMNFSINHYMLVLTTPFALLVSYFFLEDVNQKLLIGKIILLLRKYASIFILTAGSLAFSFLFVFLAGASKWWLIFFIIIYMAMVRGIYKSRSPMTAPLMLGVFILFVFTQSSLLEKAGVTSHATLQKFAVTINAGIKKDANGEVVIGVGSHDIHEKEFQVYFDQRVAKAAGSEERETKEKLARLFATKKEVYCLITERDFKHFLKNLFPGSLEVVQEDYIFRRRMNIDRGFFIALLKLDQATVRHYLKEKLVLIRKNPNV